MNSNIERKITDQDLKKVFFQSLPAEWLWNNERQMNDGYCIGMIPALEKLYPEKKDLAEAMTRHLSLFNVTPAILTFVLGISIAQEEQRANDPDNFDTDSINKVKSALMGPLSGVGDAIFLGTIRVIAIGIGLSLAIKGSILGPIAFFLVYNIPHYFIRYNAIFYGYRLGTEAITQLTGSGALNKLIKGATIVGLMVIGAMTSEMMFMDICVPIGTGEAAMTVTDIVEGIIPGLLPLLFCGFTNFMFNKKVSPMVLMLICFAIGIVGALLGIMA